MALGNFGLIISYLVRFFDLSKEQENIKTAILTMEELMTMVVI